MHRIIRSHHLGQDMLSQVRGGYFHPLFWDLVFATSHTSPQLSLRRWSEFEVSTQAVGSRVGSRGRLRRSRCWPIDRSPQRSKNWNFVSLSFWDESNPRNPKNIISHSLGVSYIRLRRQNHFISHVQRNKLELSNCHFVLGIT